jgi:acetyltransferase-like isoleucine patch superfamily enzyme
MGHVRERCVTVPLDQSPSATVPLSEASWIEGTAHCLRDVVSRKSPRLAPDHVRSPSQPRRSSVASAGVRDVRGVLRWRIAEPLRRRLGKAIAWTLPVQEPLSRQDARWPALLLNDPGNFADSQITMGRHSYGDPLRIWREGPDPSWVRIGSFCSIGYGVLFMEGGNHPTDWVSTFPLRVIFDLPGAHADGHPFDKGDVTVGHDVWIGREARIMSGVTIANGAVIAGYSVVTRDVQPYAIVGGVPAREIRRRFTDEQIDALQRIAWWEWSDEQITARVQNLNGGNVDEFIAQHDRR